MDNKYFLFTIIIYILSYLYYVSVSHGLGHKAEYLQLRRFIPCAILAVLPVALANVPLTSHMFITSFITGVMWIITYPLFYFLTNRKVSSDFGFHFDIVFGLYVIGWLMSLKVLVISNCRIFNLRCSGCAVGILLFIRLLRQRGRYEYDSGHPLQ